MRVFFHEFNDCFLFSPSKKECIVFEKNIHFLRVHHIFEFIYSKKLCRTFRIGKCLYVTYLQNKNKWLAK